MSYEYDDFEQDGVSPIFAIKMACGNTEAIAKFRKQLGDLNFEIREAVHVANKKNRADLILSLEAFESLYQKSPNQNQASLHRQRLFTDLNFLSFLLFGLFLLSIQDS